jgi:uroporphyrinogen-III synthase
MSLSGLVVGVTASRRALELAHIIRTFGGVPYIAPTVGIEVSHNVKREAESFIHRLLSEKIDYAIFMTAPGVYSLMSVAASLGIEQELTQKLGDLTVVARSPKPMQALASHGVKTESVPKENTSDGLAQLLSGRGVTGKKVMILWHGSHSSELKHRLEAEGAKVFESSTYKYSTRLDRGGEGVLRNMGFEFVAPDETKVVRLISEISMDHVGAITFTSPPAVTSFFNIASIHDLSESVKISLNNTVIVVAIGPSTQKALRQNDVSTDVLPSTYKMGSMIRSLSDFLDRKGSAKIRKRFSEQPS